MDYEYYFIRMVGYGPVLLVMSAGIVLMLRTARITRRGCWCLAAALLVQGVQLFAIPVGKDVFNKIPLIRGMPGTSWRSFAANQSPVMTQFTSPPNLGSQFVFPQGPIDDSRFYPDNRRNLSIFLCPSHPPEASVLAQQWRQFRWTRWKWILWDVLPDSLLVAVTWGLILFAVFERPTPPTFLTEADPQRIHG